MSYKPGGTHTVTFDNSYHIVIYAAFLALLSTPFTVIINRYGHHSSHLLYSVVDPRLSIQRDYDATQTTMVRAS